MLWVALLLTTLLLGFLIARKWQLPLYSFFSLGILFTSWALFIIESAGFGLEVGVAVLMLASILLLKDYTSGLGILRKKSRKKSAKGKKGAEWFKWFAFKKSELFGVALAAITFLMLEYWFIISLRLDKEGNLFAFYTFYSDIQWHMGIENFFAYQKKLVLDFPYFNGTRMYYPFLPDFYIGMLVRGGISSTEANILLNPLFVLFLVFSVYFFFEEITKSKIKSGFATFLFFFSSPGLISIATNLMGLGYCNSQKIKVDSLLTLLYSGDRTVFNFGDVVRNIFAPQRGYIIVFPIDIMMLYLALKKKNVKEYFFILGLLPFFHAHSFIVLSAVSLVFLKEIKNWKYALLSLLAAPQVLYIMLQPKENFFFLADRYFYCGITDNPLLARLIFWVRAFGPILITAIVGFVIAYKSKKLDKNLIDIGLLIFLLFILVNIISFQPSFGDNNKITIFFLLLLALFTTYITENKIAVIVLILIICENAFFYFYTTTQLFLDSLSYTATNKGFPPLFFSYDYAVAKDVLKIVNDSNSIILTRPVLHNESVKTLFNPIPALTGIKTLSTMDGYLGCVGISPKRISIVGLDALKMYRTWNCTLLKKYNVSYVYIGRYEKDLIADYPKFQLVLNKTYNNTNFLLYKVNCT